LGTVYTTLEQIRQILVEPQSRQLQVLLLSECRKLENLPKGLGKLVSLRRLIVTTKQFVLPYDEFVSLINLQALSFHDCDNIKILFRQCCKLASNWICRKPKIAARFKAPWHDFVGREQGSMRWKIVARFGKS